MIITTYQKLIPLPTRNGAFFIDNSLLESWISCPRKAEYESFRRRTSAAAKSALNFGSAIHLALDYRYSKFGDLSPMEMAKCQTGQQALLEKFFTDHPSPDHRDLGWAFELVQKHNAKYSHEPFNILVKEFEGKVQPMVEVPFAVPMMAFDLKTLKCRLISNLETLGDDEAPIIYSGKIDAGVVLDGTDIYIMDHKTTSSLGDAFWTRQRMSSQFPGYCWAWEKLTGTRPAGFYINAISTSSKPITKPRVSWDQWWDEKFQRNRENIGPEHIEEWYVNTIALIEEMLWHWQRGYFPQHRVHCAQYGRCNYYDVCYSARESREELIMGSMFTEHTWTPLEVHKNQFDLLEAHSEGSTGSVTKPPVEGE